MTALLMKALSINTRKHFNKSVHIQTTRIKNSSRQRVKMVIVCLIALIKNLPAEENCFV